MPALTQADVAELEALIAANDRGSFYLRYYEMIRDIDEYQNGADNSCRIIPMKVTAH
jgi:hypothetical protein